MTQQELNGIALAELELEAEWLSRKCAVRSGHLDFPRLNAQHKEIIEKIEQIRCLTREEYITLYGYEAWRDLVQLAGVPENYPQVPAPPLIAGVGRADSK